MRRQRRPTVTSEVESLFNDPREPEASTPDESGSDAGSAQMTVGALSSRWRQLMEDLKRNRQALTATVFQEGRPVGFEDNVLEIEFPESRTSTPEKPINPDTRMPWVR